MNKEDKLQKLKELLDDFHPNTEYPYVCGEIFQMIKDKNHECNINIHNYVNLCKSCYK